VVCSLAGSPLSAHIGVRVVAGVAAFELDTSFVGSAVTVTSTLGVTSGVWISQEIRWTGTLGSVIYSIAVSTFSTGSLTTSTYTPVFSTVT